MDVLNGKVALVTVASSGIGERIAKMLETEGVKVALVAQRQNELRRVAEEIHQQGGTALIAPTNLRDEQALRAVVEQTQNILGPMDILVNGGGIINVSPIHEIDMQDWDANMDTNLRAPTVLPGMRERKQGYIVNIASKAGVFVYGGMGFWQEPRQYAYCRGSGEHRPLRADSGTECKVGASNSNTHNSYPIII